MGEFKPFFAGNRLIAETRKFRKWSKLFIRPIRHAASALDNGEDGSDDEIEEKETTPKNDKQPKADALDRIPMLISGIRRLDGGNGHTC